MQPLSPRQQAILNRVIDTYIETAEPVGSHSVTDHYSKRYRNSYSSATVRHEMGRLEDYGYLTHPHTSAGRVPTDLGYRYYVDHSLTPEPFPNPDLEILHNRWGEVESSWDAVAERTSEILATLSEEVSVLMIPEKDSPQSCYKFYMHGSSLMLGKPEFQKIEKIRKIFDLLEQKAALIRWMAGRSRGGVQVTIGRENHTEAFEDCSVVSSCFSFPRDRSGIVALIGPRRMRYGRILPLVQKIASSLERMANVLF